MIATPCRIRKPRRSLSERIDALLPQTQCRQCGYAGCRPYAEAIAHGEAQINRCPPGGDRVIRWLARITQRPIVPLDAACGAHKPRQRAVVDERRCIGCTLCIQACPVDAIVGASKLMHTVIAQQCTGCELCITPCPVDCIELLPAPWTLAERRAGDPAQARRDARRRFEARNQRLERDHREQQERMAAKTAATLADLSQASDAASERKRAIIDAALKRARERLATVPIRPRT